MRVRTSQLADVVLIIVAVVIGASFAMRQFHAPRNEAPREQTEYVKNWEQLAATGLRIGPPHPKVTVIEFADLECPYCAKFNEQYRSWSNKYPDKLELRFVHFPLNQHRLATHAAHALECGAAQGRPGQMLDLMYAKQDSLGIKSWNSFAIEAGVRDVPAFEHCINGSSFPRIDAGVALGKKVDVIGTPTILINGWRLGLNGTALDSAFERIMRGTAPTQDFISKVY